MRIPQFVLLVLATIALFTGPVCGQEEMKIIGPDGTDVTSTIQKLMEDNPIALKEMSRLFKDIKKPSNAADKASEGLQKASKELFVNWAIKIDRMGNTFLVDQGNPETSQQFPISGGARFLNQSVNRAIRPGLVGADMGTCSSGQGVGGYGNKTTSGAGSTAGQGSNATPGDGSAGGQGSNTIPGDGSTGCQGTNLTPGSDASCDSGSSCDIPNWDNGFSSSSFGKTWSNPGTGSQNDHGSNVQVPAGYEVKTGFNKVDINVQDITPPRLLVQIDVPGQSPSVLSIRDLAIHQPVLRLPEKTSPGQFYTQNNLSPFNSKGLIEKGFFQTKNKKVRADGTIFDPKGKLLSLEEVVPAASDADMRTFVSDIKGAKMKVIKGIFVPEDVRIKVSASAIDEDETYSKIQPEEGQELNRYNKSVNSVGAAFEKYMKSDAAKDPQANGFAFHPQDGEQINFPGLKAGSLKWSIVQKEGDTFSEYASSSDPGFPHSVIFRKVDFKGSTDPDTSNYKLLAEVTDKSGNRTSVEIPIWVTPVSFNSRMIDADQERK
ncbi:MAG: hypothetical protein WA705_25410 [Candidatus Ozemobacteraceae bacterium]